MTIQMKAAEQHIRVLLFASEPILRDLFSKTY